MFELFHVIENVVSGRSFSRLILIIDMVDVKVNGLNLKSLKRHVSESSDTLIGWMVSF